MLKFDKIKLNLHIRHKIFLALVIPFIALVIAMIVMMKWSIQTGFKTYVAKIEITKMEPLVDTLKEVYQKRGNSWNDIKANKQRWMHIVYISALNSHQIPAPDGAPKPYEFEKFEEKHRRERLNQFNPLLGGGKLETENIKDNAQSFLPPLPSIAPPIMPPIDRHPVNRPPGGRPPRGGPPRGGGQGFNPSPLNPQLQTEGSDGFDPFKVMPRLALLDVNGEIVSGRMTKASIKTPVVFDGKTIGFLALAPNKDFTNIEDISFLNQQLQVLYIMLAVLLIFAFFAAILLSRQLVKPVKQIAQGIRNIANGDYATRLKIKSKDELELLASDINHLALTLEKNEHSRGRWVASISHELRTPLSILRGEIEAIQDKLRQADDKAMVSLHEQVMGLSHLVGDLYALSLSEIGELQYHMQPIAPSKILENTIEKFSNKTSQADFKITNQFKDNAGCIINGDPQRLQQLFSNIIGNSMKYTDAPGQMQISAKTSDEYIEIIFADTPPAVDETVVDMIFDCFFRADYLRNRLKGSSGLGLAICKNIVEAHNGSIKAAKSSLGGLQITVKFNRIRS